MLDDSKKIKIAEKIIHITEEHVSLEREEVKENERYVQSVGLCFFLKNWEEHYNKLKGIIYKELKLGRNFSSDYVTKFIDGMVSDTLKKGIKFVKENPLSIDKFRLKFQKSKVYIPVAGIKLGIDKFKVGNFEFVTMDDKKILWLAKNEAEMLINNPYFRTPDPEKVLEQCKENYMNYRDKTCATFEIFAENKIAMEIAEKECENILDLLKLYSYVMSPVRNIEIGFHGEINPFYSRNFAHSKNYFHFYSHLELKGSHEELIVSDRLVKNMEREGLYKVSKIYEKDVNITDLEKTLILGIHWFADSLKQREIKNQFLSLIIVLEIFLTPKSGDPISNSIAEAVAIILASKLKNRQKLKDKTKKFYGKRSAIVHGRENDMPSLEDTKKLRKIVSLLILWIIHKLDKFKDKDDILNYIDDCKLEQFVLNVRLGTITGQ